MKIRVKFVMIAILFILLTFSVKFSNANEKISMAYLYGNYDYTELVSRNNNGVNVVSTSSFDLNSYGNLILNPIDTNMVNYMHENNIKVTPFLSNHWDRAKGRKALSNMESLTDSLVAAIDTYNLDGINIDIENLTEKDREDYTKFVKMLREKLPNDKILSVAVAANPYYIDSGWQGSYDYEKLSKYSDYLLVMAYDEHYESGIEGTVASINFVENSIKYALSKVDREKIVIGLPFYGRYWKEKDSYGGYGVTLNKINSLINKHESDVKYDDVSKCMKATIKIKATDSKLSINGRTLYTGTYNFYYENDKSINEKIELIKKYNLKGIGCWSLGQETNEVWNTYASYLSTNKKDYNDIDEVPWAKDAILFAKEKGFIKGREKNNYAPKDNLTRAEFATIITRILGLYNSYELETMFYDINNHWAKNEINALTKAGFMEGYADKSFRPDNYITREEVAKVLCLIGDYQESKSELKFIDVEKERWSYNYIANLTANEIINGYGDSTFRPLNYVTRAEIAVMIQRMFE